MNSGEYKFDKPERKTGIQQYNEYKANGGTMSFTEWVSDGRHDRSLDPECDESTASLYNLLDHQEEQLDRLLTAVQERILTVYPDKLLMADTYTDLCAWAKIIEAAIKERRSKDLTK